MNTVPDHTPILTLQPGNGDWTITYPKNRFGGPESVCFRDQPVLTGCRNHIDDLGEDVAVLQDARRSHKRGTSIVRHEAYLPFGNEIRLKQQATHAANHCLVTVDLEWPRQTAVRRHLGIGSLFLPGKWKKYLCVPPSAHLAAGEQPFSRTVPEAGPTPLMIGHWHRPPLALVFFREDGLQVEIGTGSDLWRWEQSLGGGVESGSYKILLEADGLRWVHEPLMCCTEFTPAARKYRLTWYFAWHRGGDGTPPPPSDTVWREIPLKADGTVATDVLAAATPAEHAGWILDFARMPAPDSWRRCATPAALGRGVRTPQSLCWEDDGLQKRARRIIRQLAATGQPGCLRLKGINPGLCWDAHHVGKSAADGLPHWDINGLFDFSEWARQHLGPEWQIQVDPDPQWSALPSIAGLFAANGFTPAADEDSELAPTPEEE